MTKFEVKRGLGTLAFNGVEYEEGQIFDLPEKELEGIEDFIVKENENPKQEDEELPLEPANFDDLPPLAPVVDETIEDEIEDVETPTDQEEKVEDLDLTPVDEEKIEGEETKIEDETLKTDESEDDELVLDFPALEKMTRENLFKFVKEDLKNAWVEVEGIKFNSTKKEIIDALKAL